MKIIDTNGNPIESPDLSFGWLEDRTQTIHHDSVEGVEEVSHYETIAEYPNGGKDVQKIVDVPGVEAKDAWDEEEQVQVYHLYTAEELDAHAEAKKKAEEAAAAEAKKKAELEAVPERMDALEAANDDIVLMMADLIGGNNK
uniref:Uncharacterized protein n=1 Tax=Caudovirales sp. ctXjW8 TaxID=2826779 RepID=A0A8S5N506_9CAUD|nr:MAG TPA: hypothetical protein [Caudovirales sp. ctXjW8]